MYSQLRGSRAEGLALRAMGDSVERFSSPEIKVVSTSTEESSTSSIGLFVLRIVLFILLESGFLALAGVCLSRPLLLLETLSDFSFAELKGAFTVVFIIWQSLSVALVKGIVIEVFGSEWRVQASRSGTIIARETDKVSTLTAGYRDLINHFFSTATGTFRLAFIVSLLLLGLGGLAPGSLGVSTVSVERRTIISVANLTVGDPDAGGNFFGPTSLVVQRAAAITRTEQVENSTFKYATQPNWIIPLPGANFTRGSNATGTVKYFTDLIHFDYSCLWKTPLPGKNDGSISDGDLDWGIYMSPTSQVTPDDSVFAAGGDQDSHS